MKKYFPQIVIATVQSVVLAILAISFSAPPEQALNLAAKQPCEAGSPSSKKTAGSDDPGHQVQSVAITQAATPN